jgi:hypothetical protein
MNEKRWEGKMNRRTLLRYVGLTGLAQAGRSLLAQSDSSREKGTAHPIVLYCDMAVDPAQEQKMIDHFHNEFKPAAQNFEGYIDVKIVKVRRVMQGGPPLPEGVNYRFQLTYESEALRQKWISSAVHRKVWPLIENTLINKKDYIVLLTDSI